MKKFIAISGLFLSAFMSPAAFAHLGYHGGSYHPESGIDHFFVMLMFSVLAGVIAHWYSKKK